MDIKILSVLCISLLLVGVFSGCLGGDNESSDKHPIIIIEYPLNEQFIRDITMISGTAYLPDNEGVIQKVEIQINEGQWEVADGTSKWSYHWYTYNVVNGMYEIKVRAWDGRAYSAVASIMVQVDNPLQVESDSPKFAVFIAAANFPSENESKLGNGGLNFAEAMASYLIEEAGYATENIVILFDDGWIREDNGYGERIMTLQQRSHPYDIVYGGATRENLDLTLNRLIETANQYENSEVFLWLFNHGCGDQSNELTGGKLFEPSQIFLWDAIISDRTLGSILKPLKSTKTTIIIDACYAGGFAERTIYDVPTSILFRSDIPDNGRVVMTGASKFRKGYASTTYGPLFSLLWYEGLVTGDADGFRGGILNIGRPTQLSIFKDGKVSVEEAFYYARYILRTDENLEDYRSMQPQINDRYPNRGIIRNNQGLILAEN